MSDQTQSPACSLPLPMLRGFRQLQDAENYARQLNRPPWDFAVGIASLRRSGLSDNDLRWLIVTGAVEHGREIPPLEGPSRQFAHLGSLTFTKRSCFIATEAGLQQASKITTDAVNSMTPSHIDRLDAERSLPAQPLTLPTWDPDNQQLRVGNDIVKNLRHPAPLQTLILARFQEAHWPRHIVDPLPVPKKSSQAELLQQAVADLNRNQRTPLIRFINHPSSRCVSWESLAE